MRRMTKLNVAPIRYPILFLGKKWTIEILTLLMSGKKRFTDFLEANENLSSKILAERLKELIEFQLIEKIVVNMIPLRVFYRITFRGRALESIFVELAKYSISHFKESLLKEDLNEFELENYISENF